MRATIRHEDARGKTWPSIRGGCKDIAGDRMVVLCKVRSLINQESVAHQLKIRAGRHDRKGESDRKRKVQGETINIVFARILRTSSATRPVSK